MYSLPCKVSLLYMCHISDGVLLLIKTPGNDEKPYLSTCVSKIEKRV
jgi:hypothetical protein